jgi:hypothetical protein
MRLCQRSQTSGVAKAFSILRNEHVAADVSRALPVHGPAAGGRPGVVPDEDTGGPAPATPGSLPLLVRHDGGQAQRVGTIVVTADGVVDLASGLLQIAQLARRTRVVQDTDGLGPEEDGRLRVWRGCSEGAS